MFTRPNIGTSSPFRNALNSKKRKDPWQDLSVEREQELEEPEQEEDGIISALTELRNRRNPVQSEYEQFLSRAPKSEDYERSKGAKIAAAIFSGIGGYYGDENAAARNQAALDAPYERALRNFENKGKVLAARLGIENSRYKQELESVNAIREYEKEKADRDLSERKFGLDREKFGVDKSNTESLIFDRENEFLSNDITGDRERVNKRTGDRASLGQFGPSFIDKFIADEQKAVNADKRIGNRQKEGDARAFDYSSRLKEMRSADSLASNDGMTRISSSEQTNAEQAVDSELVRDPRFSSLFEQSEAGFTPKTRPTPRGAGMFRGGNEADVKAYDDAKALYDKERAEKVRARLNFNVGRFEIIK
jgi:hypothetical protein